MSPYTLINRAFEQGKGILRLAPAWVPRSFCIPGRRIKLHPDDYYALGGIRGGIDERWFSSTTPADIETPAMIRYGQLTYDEFFVSEQAAKEGVTITNPSQTDPIVMLKHFGPENPDLNV